MSQALLAALLIVAVILIYSVATLIEKKGNEQQVSQFNQLVEEIKTKKDLADASLIYNDEDKARRLLNEAQLLIGQLPQTSRQNKKTAEDLAAGIEADLVKIRHLYEIPDPIGLANLASAVQGQYDLDAGELILTKDKIYSFNKKDNTLFQINAADRNAQKLNFSSPTNDRFQLANFNSSDNSILFYHDGNGLAKLDLKAKPEEQKIVNLEINLNGQEGKVRDIATYGNKLYILSSANNQIYKYSPTLTGFGAPANWLKRSDREIKNGVSITIDGALYLLESTGQVQKFASGVPQKFELIGLDPAFSSPTKIWTDENSKFLYILDPNTRRLAVFAKDTGKLIAQYTSPKFDALKDFAVNEKEKKIYILNDNIVYGIVANHL